MHYHAEVWVPINQNVPEQIEKLLAPHEEKYCGQDACEGKKSGCETCGGFWDWYAIGGRWTGEHDKGYDATKERTNYERCWLCNGTGLRSDALGIDERKRDPSYTCNGCGKFDRDTGKWSHGPFGPGLALKHAPDFTPHMDVIPIEVIGDDLTCYTLMVAERVYHQKEWNGDDFIPTGFDGNVKRKLDELKIREGYLVTVDYHC